MTWGLAQAGNRASKTRRYLQWWDSEPEQDVMTSVLQNVHNSTLFILHLKLVGGQLQADPLG